MISRSASGTKRLARENDGEGIRPDARRNAPVFPWGRELPLIGRRADVTALRLSLDDALDGRGHTVFLKGEGGVGKTRLVAALTLEARNRGFEVAIGRAFAVESSCPYGALADALVPVLSALDPSTLAVLARGVEGDLQALLPGLSIAPTDVSQRSFGRRRIAGAAPDPGAPEA